MQILRRFLPIQGPFLIFPIGFEQIPDHAARLDMTTRLCGLKSVCDHACCRTHPADVTTAMHAAEQRSGVAHAVDREQASQSRRAPTVTQRSAAAVGEPTGRKRGTEQCLSPTGCCVHDLERARAWR